MSNDTFQLGEFETHAELPFSPSGLERRRNVRVMPTEFAPVALWIDDVQYVVSDISLGGVAFHRKSDAESRLAMVEGSRFPAIMRFPDHQDPLELELEVLGQTDTGVVRCTFVAVTESANAIIDDYVTVRVRALFSDYFS